MELSFCCTNIDLHTYPETIELERLGVPFHVVHCLGLCHYCAQGKLVLVNNAVIIAETSTAFWQALRTVTWNTDISALLAINPQEHAE